ncbi:Phospholipase A2 [Ooceraea biroi]|nr:Phospholipase A2 [Ooceraea biroi]
MLRRNICLCMLLLIFSIAIRFGDCQNDCDTEDAPGSVRTRLSWLERFLNGLMRPIEDAGNIMGNIIGHIRPRNNTQPNNRRSLSDILNRFEEQIHVIFPGTLWCGSGDIARKDDDLGLLKRTDACCRAHDKCQSNILAGDTEVNLKNNGIFTRSACSCDEEFYNCLKNASSPFATKIGTMYFDILQPQCFSCMCPTEDCA